MSQSDSSRMRGFTLVELLVVISIISLLAVFALTKIMGARRDAQKTACQERMGQMWAHFQRYETKYNRLPKESGPAFVLAIWGKQVEKSENNFKNLFFCPSLPYPDLTEEDIEDPDPTLIHYAGRNQAVKEYRVGRLTDRGASTKIIVCDKPWVEGSEPHSGECLCVLYLNGQRDVIDREAWGEDVEEMTIGPESPVEALQGVIGDD